MIHSLLRATAVAALALSAPQALAAGAHSGGHAAMHGEPGNAARASRTVTVEMHDIWFEPETISVKAGETIRFQVVNKGKLVHEFSIGTPQMHENHAGDMQMMVDHGVLLPDRIDRKAAKAMQASMGHGMHEEPNSALVEPGKSAEIVWTFPAAGEVTLEFSCNVPGHREAGMVGEFGMGNGS